jgi:hypothetical protein
MFLFSIYYLSCGNKNDNRESLNNLLFPDLDVPYPVDCGKVILANGTNPDNLIMKPYKIKNAMFNADTLNIELSYKGGCKEHEFCLVAWNYFLESNPPQAYLFLSHDSDNDFCEANITSELSIDMSPLKKEFINQYGTESDSLIIRILSSGERLNLTYKF